MISAILWSKSYIRGWGIWTVLSHGHRAISEGGEYGQCYPTVIEVYQRVENMDSAILRS